MTGKVVLGTMQNDTNDSVLRSIYDITVFGESLIDFTSQGPNEDGQMLYARNPGGAPANVAVAASKLGSTYGICGKSWKRYAWRIS